MRRQCCTCLCVSQSPLLVDRPVGMSPHYQGVVEIGRSTTDPTNGVRAMIGHGVTRSTATLVNHPTSALRGKMLPKTVALALPGYHAAQVETAG